MKVKSPLDFDSTMYMSHQYPKNNKPRFSRGNSNKTIKNPVGPNTLKLLPEVALMNLY